MRRAETPNKRGGQGLPVRVLVVLLLLVLGGCLGGTGDEPREPTPDAPAPPGPEPSHPPPARVWLLRDFGFDGCQGIEVRAHVDPEAAQELLPDNHTATVHEAGAVARWRILQCQAFTLGTTVINGTLYGDVGLDAGDHWYRFAIFSHEDTLAAAWRVAGYEVVTGNATMDVAASGPARSIEADFAGYGSRFVAAASAGLDEGATLETQTPRGLVVWNETVEAAGVGGLGTWSVPPEDPLSALLADGRAVAVAWQWLEVSVSDAEAYRE